MPAKRLRVLHVVQNLNYGGMERLIATLANGMDGARFDPHVLVLQYAGRFGREVRGTVHRAGPLPPWSLLHPAALAREIARIAPDVVHSHSGVWLKAAGAARMAGVPRVVHTEHGRPLPIPLADRLLDRAAARRTDLVAAVSEPLAEHLRARVAGPRTRVVTVPNGVDTAAFRPGPRAAGLRRALGAGGGEPLLGSVGRLEPVKGYEVMLRALALARGPAEHARLVLVGDGSARAALEALARELGVADRVHLLGWRDDVHPVHRAIDLFTLSSHSEGTSVSLLEAMSAGLCPVVTEVGGNADVLGGALAHRLVPPASPAALARAWEAALADPARMRADGAAARARVEAGFSAARMVRRYEELYAGPGRRTHTSAAAPAGAGAPEASW